MFIMSVQETNYCSYEWMALIYYYFFFRHDVVPIVMGARPEDYAISAPFKSYIHVDDFEGPKELAEYLHKLDQDDQLYNEYFKWKVFLDFFFSSGYL